MGVPTGGGAQLGQATGRIVIDTSDMRRAQREVQAASQRMSSALGLVGQATGITFGAAAVAQIGRFALEADKIATAYSRQSVAALNLAGSQGKLNELLDAYNEATGGAIDKAQALADVTRLQAVGFADSAAELEEFARAARGISVATGQSQDYVISQLQLAIANQSTLRLDQLGLGVSEVKERIDELKDANAGLTTEMAYQQAILELANNKFGDLVDSAEAQASGVEQLTRAWADLRLELGKALQGPLSTVGSRLAERLDATSEVIELERRRQAANRTGVVPGGLSGATDVAGAQAVLNNLRQGLARVMQDIETGARPASQTGPLLIELNEKIRAASISVAGLSAQRLLTTGDLPQGAPDIRGGGGAIAAPGFSDEQTAAINDWARDVADIERQANNERLDATRQYEESRTNTIREYEKTIAREAEDFGRSRVRAEEDHAKSIADVRTNAARNETRQARDFALSISDTRDDSAERIADAREDANKRLIELEEDYQRNRERAFEDHNDKLLDAAGRLDAEAVYKEQRNFARQQEVAEDAYDEQRDNLKEQLQERLDDEAESLEESIRERQDAYDRQLQDARDADAERILDMEADFELRKEREDEDRGIRLERLAQDHRDQLDEQARAHALRMEQITLQEAEQTKAVTDALDARMLELGEHNAKLEAEQRRHEAQALADYTAHVAALEATWASLNQLQGPSNRIPLPSFVTPSSSRTPTQGWQNTSSPGRVVNIGTISIQGDGLNEREVAELVIQMIENEGG